MTEKIDEPEIFRIEPDESPLVVLCERGGKDAPQWQADVLEPWPAQLAVTTIYKLPKE